MLLFKVLVINKHQTRGLELDVNNFKYLTLIPPKLQLGFRIGNQSYKHRFL